MLRKYAFIFKSVLKWYYNAINSKINVYTINSLKYIRPIINQCVSLPCKVGILSYYLNTLNNENSVLPFLFDGSDFWEPSFELFVDIGAGHGELLYAWSQLATRVPKLFFDQLINNTGLQVISNATRHFYPVVVGFETKSRYYRLLLDLNKFEFNYLKNNLEHAQLTFPFLGCPQWLIYKEDGFLATTKFKYNSVSGFFVLFPDPWNKKRHYKRRDVKLEWLLEAFYRLKPTGFILIVTDHPDYANFIKMQLNSLKNKLKKCVTVEHFDKFIPSEWGLPATHYYKKNIKQTDVFAFLIKKQYQCQ